MKAVETNELKDYPCQKTEFYIMDENRNLTNIDEYIKSGREFVRDAITPMTKIMKTMAEEE